jgi:hypothetical protein
MIASDPNARAVSLLLDSNRVPINLIGDRLLPADIDGKRPPNAGASIPLVGTQDDGGPLRCHVRRAAHCRRGCGVCPTTTSQHPVSGQAWTHDRSPPSSRRWSRGCTPVGTRNGWLNDQEQQ